MLVLDTSLVLVLCVGEDGFRVLENEELVAPPLMWSEARSVLHQALWRGEIEEEAAKVRLKRLSQGPIRERKHRRLAEQTWTVAGELGWAKTYDAEFVALASLLNCRLVTLDQRLRRGADRLGFVVGPAEL